MQRTIKITIELLRVVRQEVPADRDDVATVAAALHRRVTEKHLLAIPGAEVTGWVTGLIETFNQPGGELEAAYKKAAPKVEELFDKWFGK